MDKMKTPSGEQKLKDEQAAKQAVEKSRRPVPAVSDYQEPDYSLLPKGAHAKLPMIQDNSPVSATADGQSDTPQTYTVKPGDSLSKILGTSDPAAIGAFMRENGLDSSTIQPGQKLTLPRGSYQASDAALGQATLNVDNTKRVAASSSLPDGWNMRDASAATNTRLVSDMLAGRSSEPDNAIGKFKQDALDWIVNQGASTNSSAGQLGAALAYGVVDMFAPEGYGGAALMVGGAALGAGARAVRGLEVGSTAAMRSEAAANILEARNLLRNAGVPVQARNEIIRSFDLETFRVQRLDSETTAYRLFDDSNVGIQGRYVSTDFFASQTDRIQNFALMKNSATRLGEVTMPQESVVFTGKVAPQPNFGPGLTGGANQIFLTGPLSNYGFREILMPR